MIMNKSSGTIFHASPEGVSIRDDTNNKSSGTIFHASPEGFYKVENCSLHFPHFPHPCGSDGRTDISSYIICTSTIHGGCSRVTQGAVTEEQLPR